MTLFENPRALPRAFVPKVLRYGEDAGAPARGDGGRDGLLADSVAVRARVRDEANGEAALELRAVGPDLLVSADVSQPGLRRDVAAGLAGLESGRGRPRARAHDGQPRVRRALAAAGEARRCA